MSKSKDKPKNKLEDVGSSEEWDRKFRAWQKRRGIKPLRFDYVYGKKLEGD